MNWAKMMIKNSKSGIKKLKLEVTKNFCSKSSKQEGLKITLTRWKIERLKTSFNASNFIVYSVSIG